MKMIMIKNKLNVLVALFDTGFDIKGASIDDIISLL